VRKKILSEEKKYWSQAFVSASQVTFGLFWASLFVPLDKARLIMIGLNGVLTLLFLLLGWLLVKK